MNSEAHTPGARDALLVVAPPEERLEAVDWPVLLAGLGGPSRLTLLCLAEAPPPRLLACLEERGDAWELKPGAPLLRAEMESFHEELREWWQKISLEGDLPPDFWLTQASESNFRQPQWFELVRLNALDGLLSQGAYANCLYVGRAETGELLGRLCRAKGIGFASHYTSRARRGRGRHLLKELAKYGLNLLSEVYARRKTRVRQKATPCRVLVYAKYPANWQRNGPSLSYRFTGMLAGGPPEAAGPGGCYLISLLRANRSQLLPPKRLARSWRDLPREEIDLPWVIAESHGSWRDLLSCYLDPRPSLALWRSYARLRRKGLLTWRGLEVAPLFWPLFVTGAVVDLSKNLYLEKCLRRAAKVSSCQVGLAPLFEFAEGRAAVRAFKGAGAKVMGLQHGSWGLAHRWRVLAAPAVLRRSREADCRRMALDRLGVEGSLPAAWAERDGIPAGEVAVVGAPRLLAYPPVPEGEGSGGPVLVVGDYHEPQRLFATCQRLLAGSGQRVLFRPHPTTHAETVRWLESLPPETRAWFALGDNRLGFGQEVARLNPVCILAGPTGVTVEAAASGWPVGMVGSNWLPDHNPMLAGGGEAGIFCSNDQGELLAWIERLNQDQAYRQAYRERCRDMARQLIAHTADEAAAELRRSLP